MEHLVREGVYTVCDSNGIKIVNEAGGERTILLLSPIGSYMYISTFAK